MEQNTEYTLEKGMNVLETPETLKTKILNVYAQIGEIECRQHQLVALAYDLTKQYNELMQTHGKAE